MNPVAKVQEAWRTAAKELGFEFVAPYSLNCGTEIIQYHGFVSGFGSAKGTVFLASSTFKEDVSLAGRIAASEGYFFSVISAAGYGSFKRADFLETLKDWGWHSTELIPPHGFALPIRTEKRKGPNQSSQPTPLTRRG